MEDSVDPNTIHQLLKAAQHGDEAVVKQLLEDGIDPNHRDEIGRTPLSLAAEFGHEVVVKQLLAKDGVDLNPMDNINCRTPLSSAAWNGCKEAVEQLLAKDGVKLNPEDNKGRTPLSLAAYNGHEAVVKQLLAKDGIELNARDSNGWTPLLLAAEYGREAVQLLLLSKRIHRRIIVCCDGTWNDREEEKQPFTNVTRIQSCLEARDDRHGHRYDQISYYIDGIGTGTTLYGSIRDGSTGQGKKLAELYDEITNNVSVIIGILRKIREAYRHVCSTYVDEHDQIILIGFSRGAFTVQCLARLINDVGLVDGNWLNKELPEIFKLWTEGHSLDDESSPLKKRCDDLARRARLRQGIQIKAYAVWETVKSLFGESNIFDFVGERLPSNIEKAFQALALDERRKQFQPVVLTRSRSTELRQCWFLGSHSDIGGGYQNSGLANISLCWMISQLRDLVKFSEAACWEATDEGSILQLSITKENTEIVGLEKYNSLRGIWWIGGSETRGVGDRQQPSESPDSDSNEMIHFSVHVLQQELTRREPRGGSDPLEAFKRSPDRPVWSRTVAGQTRQIPEEDPSEYEIKMLQRWIDQDMEFKFETAKGGGQPIPHLDSILLYPRG